MKIINFISEERMFDMFFYKRLAKHLEIPTAIIDTHELVNKLWPTQSTDKVDCELFIKKITAKRRDFISDLVYLDIMAQGLPDDSIVFIINATPLTLKGLSKKFKDNFNSYELEVKRIKHNMFNYPKTRLLFDIESDDPYTDIGRVLLA